MRTGQSLKQISGARNFIAFPGDVFTCRAVTALGVTWILDGLEVTLAGSLAGALKDSPSLHFSNTDIGFCKQCLSRRRHARCSFFWLANGLAWP